MLFLFWDGHFIVLGHASLFSPVPQYFVPCHIINSFSDPCQLFLPPFTLQILFSFIYWKLQRLYIVIQNHSKPFRILYKLWQVSKHVQDTLEATDTLKAIQNCSETFSIFLQLGASLKKYLGSSAVKYLKVGGFTAKRIVN